MSEKRTTTVNMGGLELELDVDEYWSGIASDPFDEQLAAVTDEFHWLVVLGWIDLTAEVKEQFWLAFRDEAAERNRDVAANGLAWVNFKEERELLNRAASLQDELEEARNKGTVATDDALKARLMLLGMKFAELVTNLDHKAFDRMSKIIKARGTPVSEKPRGGEDSAAGQMLREFVALHVKTKSLPTKKELREACGLADDVDRARELMKELGLSGLPQTPPPK